MLPSMHDAPPCLQALVSMHPEQPSRRPLDAYLVDRDLLLVKAAMATLKSQHTGNTRMCERRTNPRILLRLAPF
jgi:hypothetical protein